MYGLSNSDLLSSIQYIAVIFAIVVVFDIVVQVTYRCFAKEEIDKLEADREAGNDI